MSIDRTTVPVPVYAAALRQLVGRAFAPATPVPDAPLPGGSLPSRLVQSAEGQRELVTCSSVDGVTAPASMVDPAEYWERALPHRLILHGPLNDIADSELETEERGAVERRLLGVYYQRYNALPLPADLLTMLADHEADCPDDQIAERLEHARALIIPSPTAGEARRRRLHLRAEAIRRCADGTCSEHGTGIAELFVDVITLCEAARLDLEQAISLTAAHGGSVSRAMKALADRGDTELERLLPHLLSAKLTVDDFPSSERTQVLDLASRRKPPPLESFLQRAEPSRRSSVTTTRNRKVEAPAADEVQPSSTQPQDPRALYQQIRGGLESRIIARADLCRRLALAGVAAVLGVKHQRILLCGCTGSGKSHAAAALADVLERPHLRIDMADVTATGWKGLDIPDVLDALAEKAGRDLNGSVLVLDELDKIRIEPGTEGNSLQAQVQLQASLLALIDGGITTTDGSAAHQLDTSGVLVIGTGAFGGEFISDPPTTDDLVHWGWIPEFAARWGERICLRPPTRAEARDLLEHSDRSVDSRLGPLTNALGIELIVPAQVIGYVVDLWFRSDADFRSASEWLLAAARSRLLDVLEGEGVTSIVLAPDDIERESRQPPRSGW
jgi:hypothetical protein